MDWKAKTDEGKCPKCKSIVFLEEYLDDSCPVCGHGCVWTKQFSDDFSTSWDLFMWDEIKGG